VCISAKDNDEYISISCAFHDVSNRYSFAFSRHDAPEGCKIFAPPQTEGAGAMVLTAYFVLPGGQAFWPPPLAD
jgi:hypothetical protein